MKAYVHRADDILTAIRIAKEFNVNLTLDYYTEGHLIRNYIINSGFDVIIGPTLSFNSKIELSNKTFKTPSILVMKGVLDFEFENALEAITINAAE